MQRGGTHFGVPHVLQQDVGEVGNVAAGQRLMGVSCRGCLWVREFV